MNNLDLEKEREEYYSEFGWTSDLYPEDGVNENKRPEYSLKENWQYIEELVKKKVGEARGEMLKEMILSDDIVFRDQYLGKEDN
jgi:hypothetical protein